MRHRLKEIEIKAFRGFNAQQSIELDCPLVVICGGNGAGKSSITTAIEWALFPQESVTLKEHGIRERKDWSIQHSHAKEDALVKLILRKGDQPLTIQQSSSKASRGSTGGSLLNRPKCSYSDFSGLAFVHQETIRNFIVDTAKSRTETFQRLLGAGWIQDLATIVEDWKKKLACDDADTKVRNLHNRLQDQMKEARVALNAKSVTILERGIQEPFQDTANLLVYEINDEIAEVTKLLDVVLPTSPSLDPIQTYRKRLQDHVALIKKAGLTKRHSSISVKKTEIERSIAELETAAKHLKEKERLKTEAVSMFGNPDLELKVASESEQSLLQQMKTLTDEGAIMRESLTYFTSHPELNHCPSCLRSDLPKDLVKSLSSRIEQLSTFEQKELQEKIDAARFLKQAAEASKAKLEQLSRDVVGAENLHSNKLHSLEVVLDRTFQDTESPEALAKSELSRVEVELHSLTDLIKSSNDRLEKVDELAKNIDLLADVFELQKRIDTLSNIQVSDEWKVLSQAHEKLSKREAALILLVSSLRTLASGFATSNLTKAQSPISTIFHQLTRRSDYESISIDEKNGYAIRLIGKKGPRPISELNQSDLNGLALAVVTGMAITFPEVHDLEFLILDDPSQGMDPSMIKSLATVLGSLAEKIQIIVATPDSFLQEELGKTSVRKRFIRLRNRDTATASPSVQLDTQLDTVEN
jgi:DNA repair exonuclease SbcCD ATPase subunit